MGQTRTTTSTLGVTSEEEVIITNIQVKELPTLSHQLFLSNSSTCASVIQSPMITCTGVSVSFSLLHASQVPPSISSKPLQSRHYSIIHISRL